MIQIGGLSTFSPFAARKIRSFFKGSNGIVNRENIRLCGAALTMWVQKQRVVAMVHGCHMPYCLYSAMKWRFNLGMG